MITAAVEIPSIRESIFLAKQLQRYVAAAPELFVQTPMATPSVSIWIPALESALP
jgi:hypothetical protein